MIYKIIGFTESGDCKAITDKGQSLIVDPFVGCAFLYENKEALLDTWFETIDLNFYSKDSNVLLPAENDFKVVQKRNRKTKKVIN